MTQYCDCCYFLFQLSKEFKLHIVLRHNQGRNEGGKGGAKSQWRRRMAAGGAEKSQRCHKCFLQHSTFASKDLSFEHGGAKLASCPGRHPTLLRRWTQYFHFSEVRIPLPKYWWI